MAGLDDDPGEVLFTLNPEGIKRLLGKEQQEPHLWQWQPQFGQQEPEEPEEPEEPKAFTTEELQAMKRAFERAKKQFQRMIDKGNHESGCIYDFSDIAKNFQIKDIKTFKKWGLNLYIWKKGNKYLFEEKTLYKAISDNSYKYINGIKSPCNYDRLPEYLTINECAEKLGLKDGRQFRRNYIDNNPARLEGVEILKIGSTVRIEKVSFLRYVETLGGETAK